MHNKINEKDICKWIEVPGHSTDVWDVECVHLMVAIDDVIGYAYKFCPFCGKKLNLRPLKIRPIYLKS
jgi:hypothetical protein